jgi:hypothetical protein
MQYNRLPVMPRITVAGECRNLLAALALRPDQRRHEHPREQNQPAPHAATASRSRINWIILQRRTLILFGSSSPVSQSPATIRS